MVRFNHFIWIEDLIALVEEGIGAGAGPAGSVESITRNLGQIFSGHPAISWFSIVVENLADGYSTFATLEGGSQMTMYRSEKREVRSEKPEARGQRTEAPSALHLKS